MSVRVWSYVWKHSKNRGSALLLLLAIADHCHDDGNGAWPAVSTLAEKVRLKERRVQQLLRLLETSGELVTDPRPHKTHLFSIPMKGAEDCTPTGEDDETEGAEDCTLGVQGLAPGGAADDTLRVQGVAPEPSSNASPNHPGIVSTEVAAPTALRSRGNEDAGVRRGRQKIAERLVGGVTGPFRTKRAVLLPQIDALLARGWAEGWIENTLRLGSASRWDAYRFAESFTDMNGAEPIRDEVKV